MINSGISGVQIGDRIRYQLWDQLWDQLGDQLGDQLWYQLEDQGSEIWEMTPIRNQLSEV